MIIKRALFSAVAFMGLGMGAGTAHAAGAITGSISMIGFFDCACFAPGDTSIVSQLTTIVSLDPSTSGAGFGDYAGSVGLITPVEDILLDPMAPGFPGSSSSSLARWFGPVSTTRRACCDGRDRARASARRASAGASRRPPGRPAFRLLRVCPSPRASRSLASACWDWRSGGASPPDRSRSPPDPIDRKSPPERAGTFSFRLPGTLAFDRPNGFYGVEGLYNA